ncbi:MAG: helix-turn-helix domain-containing protein [Betaproteobacteria bacterium]|nr:helix-turn-helix domain-containing protein [Betaproteobacteria bacterium]
MKPRARQKIEPDSEGHALDSYLGASIRELRLRHRLTSAEVAKSAGISRGMISKIENGLSSTSLDTLHRIASALGETLSNLFLNFDKPSGGGQLVKKGKGMEVIRRGTKRGHKYQLLAFDRGPRKLFDPFFVTLTDASEVFPTFKHPGTELIYMLEGKMVYRHGQQTYSMSAGDSLTFSAPVPHGPEKFIKLPIKMLVFIVYDDATDAR